MMMVPGGVKVHLALGYTDMRKGLDGLAMLVQEVLKQDPFSGHLFAFRGKAVSILKIRSWDDQPCRAIAGVGGPALRHRDMPGWELRSSPLRGAIHGPANHRRP